MSICLSDDGVAKSSPQSMDFVTLRQPNTQQTLCTENNYLSDQLKDFKEEMRRLMTYFTATQKEELSSMNAHMTDLRQSSHNIESSISFLTEQNNELKNRVSEMEERANDDRQYILFLENKVDSLEQGYRKTNFELKNVPRQVNEKKEDLINMVVHLSETINCQITKSDLRDIYRVKSKKPEEKNTPIIVETNSTILKIDFLKMAKLFNSKNKTKLVAKHLGLKTQEDTPVYLSEHLTAKFARLHFLARDLQKTKQYKFCWTSYGKVYVRKTEQSPIVTIRSESQIHHLMSEE